MTIISCPHCGDKVTAPTSVSGDAIVRCPLCNDEYPLSKALLGVPPMLIVISPGSSAAPAENEIRLAPAAETPKPFVFEERPAPRKLAPRPRPVKREKNPLVEMLKIVAGGVVGLALGQLILWWVPGLQLGQRDPLDLGPKVSRYVPWIIPAALRVPELEEDTSVAQDDRQYRTSEHRSSKRSTLSQNQLDDEPPPDLLDDYAKKRAIEPDDDSLDLVPFEDQLPTVPDETPAETNIGVRNPPIMATDEVNASLASAQAAWEAQSSSGKTEELAIAVGDLARCMTFADPRDEEIQGTAEAARSLMRDIASDREQLQALIESNQSSTTRQSFRGRVVRGTVRSMESAGKMFVSMLETPSGDVQVVSVVDPHKTLEENENVLILGVDVTKPMTQLNGFAGGDEPVILGGLVAKIPSQSSEPSDEQPAENESEVEAPSDNAAESSPESAAEEDEDRPPAPPESADQTT